VSNQPPPSPPPAYVRRIEGIEAAVDRLTREGVGVAVAGQTTRERFFTAFARLERMEQRIEGIGKQLEQLSHQVDRLVKGLLDP